MQCRSKCSHGVTFTLEKLNRNSETRHWKSSEDRLVIATISISKVIDDQAIREKMTTVLASSWQLPRLRRSAFETDLDVVYWREPNRGEVERLFPPTGRMNDTKRRPVCQRPTGGTVPWSAGVTAGRRALRESRFFTVGRKKNRRRAQLALYDDQESTIGRQNLARSVHRVLLRD